MFDADLLVDNMVERFCLKRLGGIWSDDEIRVEEYIKQSMPRTFRVTNDEEYFTTSILDAVSKAKTGREATGVSKPVYVACRSKRGMMDLLNVVTGRSDPEFLTGGIAYFSSSSTTKQMSAWEDIDKFISENAIDIILTTSKVTVCADMKSPIAECFIMANSMGGCHARDLLQTIGRARQPDSNIITALIRTTNVAKTGNDGDEPSFWDIKASMLNDAVIRKKYMRLLEMEAGFDVEDENRFNKLVVHKSPDWMINLVCDYELEIQNNQIRLFLVTLIRNAIYKGWRLDFKGKPEIVIEEDNESSTLKESHKATGDEIKERETALLEEMKMMSIDELTALTKVVGDDGPHKERVYLASFLLRFPTFIPHMTLDELKYYKQNYGVFDRTKALVMDEARLCAIDISRMLKATNKGILERAPLLHNAITLLGGLLQNVLGLNFHESFMDAPIEEKDHKKRCIDEYDISKSELASHYQEISECTDELQRNLGIKRTRRKSVYKDAGMGACRLVDTVLKLFGRKLESCKDRSSANRDHNAYRIVQDTSFSLLYPHYTEKDCPDHMKSGIRAMIRHAKKENPHLLKKRPQDCIVSASTVSYPRTSRMRHEHTSSVSGSMSIHQRRQAEQFILDGSNEEKDVDEMLLDLLDQ